MKPLESHALVDGFPKPQPDTLANTWISDHAAVVASFELLAADPGTVDPGIGTPSTNPTEPAVQPGAGNGSGSDESAAGQGGGQAADPLASTGLDSWLWLFFAVVLIALGGTLLITKGNTPSVSRLSSLFRRSTGRK